MSKKGFQLSLNVIVVAILALIVLVSSTIFFADKFGFVSGEMKKCSSLNGQCISDKGDCKGGRIVNASCEGQSGSHCCVNAATLGGGKINEGESS